MVKKRERDKERERERKTNMVRKRENKIFKTVSSLAILFVNGY